MISSGFASQVKKFRSVLECVTMKVYLPAIPLKRNMFLGTILVTSSVVKPRRLKLWFTPIAFVPATDLREFHLSAFALAFPLFRTLFFPTTKT
jgi:hypothetical protein